MSLLGPPKGDDKQLDMGGPSEKMKRKMKTSHKIKAPAKKKTPPKCGSPADLQALMERNFANAISCDLNDDTSEAGKDADSWGHIWLLKRGKKLWRAQPANHKVRPSDYTDKERWGAWFASTKAHAQIHIKEGQEYLAEYEVTSPIHVFYHKDIRTIDGVTSGYDYIGVDSSILPGTVSVADKAQAPFDIEVAEAAAHGGTPIMGYTGCMECEVYLRWLTIDLSVKLAVDPAPRVYVNPLQVDTGDKARQEAIGDFLRFNNDDYQYRQELDYLPNDYKLHHDRYHHSSHNKHYVDSIDSAEDDYVGIKSIQYGLLFGLGICEILILFSCIVIILGGICVAAVGIYHKLTGITKTVRKLSSISAEEIDNI